MIRIDEGVEEIEDDPTNQERMALGFLLERGIDRALEVFEWLSTRKKSTIDEEGRRPGHTEFLSLTHVFVDPLLDVLRRGVPLELIQIEPEFLRVAFEGLGREISLAREDLVVHFPELALPMSGFGRRVGSGRLRMNREGQVLEDEPNLASVRFVDLGERGSDAVAKWALEIGPFDDRDQSVFVATHRRLTDRDLVLPRRIRAATIGTFGRPGLRRRQLRERFTRNLDLGGRSIEGICNHDATADERRTHDQRGNDGPSSARFF